MQVVVASYTIFSSMLHNLIRYTHLTTLGLWDNLKWFLDDGEKLHKIVLPACCVTHPVKPSVPGGGGAGEQRPYWGTAYRSERLKGRMLATWRMQQRASCLALSVMTPARAVTAATVPCTSTSFTVNIIVTEAVSVLYQYDQPKVIMKLLFMFVISSRSLSTRSPGCHCPYLRF